MVMFVRALVPTGWMYAPDAQEGHFRIQVCAGHWVNWDPDTGLTSEVDEARDQQQDGELSPECPYSLITQTVLPLENGFDASSSVWSSLTIPRPSTGPPRTRSNQTQLPARGPPYSV